MTARTKPQDGVCIAEREGWEPGVDERRRGSTASAMARGAASRWGSRVGLMLFGSLAGLLLFEAGVRLFAPQPPLLYQPDVALGWVHIPGLRVTYPGHSGPVEVAFNRQGHRDIEHQIVKPAGVRRVLVLGDSYMEAADVALQDAFTMRLGRMAGAAGAMVEVINAGVGGYGTDQELMYFLREGWAYQPDLVLLAFTIDNDVHDNLAKGYCQAALGELTCRPPGSSARRRAVATAKAWIQRHFQSYFFLSGMLSHVRPLRGWLHQVGLVEMRNTDDAAHPLPVALRMLHREDGLRQGWDLTVAILAQMRREVRARGGEFAVMIIPGRAQVNAASLQDALERYRLDASTLDLDQPNRLLRAFGREHGVRVIDLVPAFREVEAKGAVLAKGHWTAAGHRLAAEETYRELARAGLL